MSSLTALNIDRSTISPIVAALDDARELDRWATPAILVDQHRTFDIFTTDISCSYGDIGTLADNTGVFADACAYAAEAHGAKRSFLSVNGSTGSNQVIALALALLGPSTHVLVNRGAHHSVSRSLVHAAVTFRWIEQGYDTTFEALQPVNADDVVRALLRNPDADAIWITSPTYEGAVANVPAIVDVVQREAPHVCVIIDEAWGAHFAFHPRLSHLTALAGGAHVVAQSTHKVGGSLQQTGLLHLGVGVHRCLEEAIDTAFRGMTTSSPSYHLLGSIDAATRAMSRDGRYLIDLAAHRAQALGDDLRERLPALTVLGKRRGVRRDTVNRDPMKLTFGLHRFDITGHELASALAEQGIIVEKSGIRSITFLATYQLDEDAPARAADAFALAVGPPRRSGRHSQQRSPFGGDSSRIAIEPSLATRLALQVGRPVALQDAVGRIALEEAEVYPPGVPIIVPGQVVTKEAVQHLLETKSAGGRIVARDMTLATLLVAGEGALT